MLVVVLSSNIHAFLSSTFRKKLFFRVVMEEHVHIAFNLLRGRPIDLAILLSALLLADDSLICDPAPCGALCEIVCARSPITSALLAPACLKILLGRIAVHISSNEFVIRTLAVVVQSLPLTVKRFVLAKLLLYPASIIFHRKPRASCDTGFAHTVGIFRVTIREIRAIHGCSRRTW
jgi:hypothetical protein